MGNLYSVVTNYINTTNNNSNKNNLIVNIPIKLNHNNIQSNKVEKKTEVIYSNEKIKLFNNKYKITIDQEIKFINSFNEEINETYTNLFYTWDKIIFGFSFNQNVKNKFTPNVILIKFGHNFNQPIESLCINGDENFNLVELILGSHFNQKVDNLTQGLIKITFGECFNQDVSNLPTSIEYIKFGDNFNNPVDYLPCGLTWIFFGNKFNYPIDNLPSGIEFIRLGNEFDIRINLFSSKLKKIEISKKYYDDNKLYLDKIIKCELTLY